MQYRHALFAAFFAAGCIAEAQPVSTAGHQGTAPEGIATQSRAVDGATVLLVQDVQPWEKFSNEQVLHELGVAYDIVNSSDLRQVVLTNYSVIIVASDQPQHFYDRLGRFTSSVYQWLRSGARTLEFHGADNGWRNGTWTFTLPKGVTRDGFQFDTDVNFIHVADSPLVAGLPSPMHGTPASLVQFALGGVGKNHAIIVSPERKATLLDYCYGLGRVIASGQVLEYSYGNPSTSDHEQVLPNMITESTQVPGCHR